MKKCNVGMKNKMTDMANGALAEKFQGVVQWFIHQPDKATLIRREH